MPVPWILWDPRFPSIFQFLKKVTSEASPRCVLFSEIQGEEAERRSPRFGPIHGNGKRDNG